jgi:hypothetical protein
LASDHWYSEVFRALPDLVCRLLPGLETEAERDATYLFRPVALKKVAHHPDGVLWPRQHPGGSEQRIWIPHSLCSPCRCRKKRNSDRARSASWRCGRI